MITIESIRELIDKIGSDDYELRSHWAQYLCILTSGAIEQEVLKIFHGYVQESWQSDAASEYLKETAKPELWSPNAEKIRKLAKIINKSWDNDIRDLISEHGTSIRNVSNNRNRIAHGEDTDLTLDRLKKDFCGTVKFLKGLKEIVARGGGAVGAEKA